MKEPSQLARIQRTLKAALFHPKGLQEQMISSVIRDQAPISRLARMEIYRYAIHKRFDDALEEDFPVCRMFIERASRGGFHQLGREYGKLHPSSHFNLSRFGHLFPAFLARRKTLLGKFPFLADLARTEWAMVDAFFSEQGPELDLGRIATLAPEELSGSRVLIDPSVKLLVSAWPVGLIFHAGRSAPAKKSWILVYRGLDSLLYVETVSEAQFRLLKDFQGGVPLLRAASRLSDKEAPKAMKWFNEWTQSGIIRGLAPKGTGRL